MPIVMLHAPVVPTTSVDTFFPLVNPEVKDCPTALIRQAILRTVIDFCEKSLAITVLLDPIALQDTVQDYQLAIPDNMRMVEIVEMFGPQLYLTPKTMRELQELYPNWLTAIGSTPSYYLMLDAVNVTFVPIPTNPPAGFSVIPRVAITPLITSPVVPQEVFDRHSDAISDGTKARLMRMSKQPWSDPQESANCEDRYLAAIDKTRIDIMRLRTAGSTTVAPRKFR